jgi:hypothetical protein
MGRGDALSSLALMTSNSESESDVSRAPRAIALALTSAGVYVVPEVVPALAAALVEALEAALFVEALAAVLVEVPVGSSNQTSRPSILITVIKVSDQFAKLVWLFNFSTFNIAVEMRDVGLITRKDGSLASLAANAALTAASTISAIEGVTVVIYCFSNNRE